MSSWVRDLITSEPVPRARGPRLAVDWHMAEGGGTVPWVHGPGRPHPHFVVTYQGIVVQTLELDRMHTLVDTHAPPTPPIRRTDDPPYVWEGVAIRYGFASSSRVLGPWATTTTTEGPNHATIGVEVEGFAATGPRGPQLPAIAGLFTELRTMWPSLASLGHRDHTSTKACPGHMFPWHLVGGHASSGGSDMGPAVTLDPGPSTGRVQLPAGTDVIRARDGDRAQLAQAAIRDCVLGHFAGGLSGPIYLIDARGDELHYVRRDAPGLIFTPSATPPSIPDPGAEAKGYNDGLAAAEAAVHAIPRR